MKYLRLASSEQVNEVSPQALPYFCMPDTILTAWDMPRQLVTASARRRRTSAPVCYNGLSGGRRRSAKTAVSKHRVPRSARLAENCAASQPAGACQAGKASSWFHR